MNKVYGKTPTGVRQQIRVIRWNVGMYEMPQCSARGTPMRKVMGC